MLEYVGNDFTAIHPILLTASSEVRFEAPLHHHHIHRLT